MSADRARSIWRILRGSSASRRAVGSGLLEFRLPDGLEGGVRCRLTLEASDNRDRRGSASIEFVLAGGGDRGVPPGGRLHVPNPMDRDTTFFVEMNQTSGVTIRIFTASGRLVREIRRGPVTPA